jgi:acyl-CoA synthetase (AMP-forming)/AMP-acid ligase II
MSEAATLFELVETGRDDATAIAAPERRPCTYAELRAQTLRIGSELNAIGIGRNDRVAIVLQNGPEMASAFLAVASAATACPLNPGYRAEEFDFYLTDLRATALLVEATSQSHAIPVARRLGVPILQLSVPPTAPAGAFDLLAEHGPSGASTLCGRAGPDDVALLLHTSGTTARPKIVPLSQRKLSISARNIRDTLALTAHDRALNIMPLFHIHGLMAGLLAPLSAGGSVCCTPGFNALKFFAWMRDAQPTWYTAVPTMHQAILARASHAKETIATTPLRFIRSSSSALPPQVIRDLESTFEAPVIEAYGMTEAAHQMASNPLPPRRRKPGTVGTAAGPEIGIMDAQGELLGPGQPGEVVIRGPSVTSGFESNPRANAESFVNGWYRTGDQGMLDAEGYLTITGRLKEIINRGGEKISPREVDEVLMDHPAVLQVVTFAVPHDRLGEDVAAAVVLRQGSHVNEQELREFAATRIANFKVPRHIAILPEIPKGPTGKLQRIGLAQKLGFV